MMKRVLIVGSGGREHALAWKLAQSPQVSELFVAPGNAGTAEVATNVAIDAMDLDGLVTFAVEEQIDLTVVGPEAPLAAGLVDRMQRQGLAVFGPTKAAAQLEASKVFAKDFMAAHGIPTASFATFADFDAAVHYVSSKRWPHGLVVKASGLAAGKGVIICDTQAEGVMALNDIMRSDTFGGAGAEVVVEERLTGPELSVLALCDGQTARLLTPARDHKRIGDGDVGPNTGGMGAFGPPAGITPSFLAEIQASCIDPVLAGMAAQGTPFAGMLFVGLMLTPDGPRVLEYNCRFGDPETQVVLPLLASDLFTILSACASGRLAEVEVRLHEGVAATVVMAAPGYPGTYPKGLPISGVAVADARPDTVVFHAGTAMKDGQLVSNGGRVLAVSGWAPTLAEALAKAYAGVHDIHFAGAHFRHDIGAQTQPAASAV